MTLYAIYLTILIWCFVAGLEVWHWRHPASIPKTQEIATVAYASVAAFIDPSSEPTHSEQAVAPLKEEELLQIHVSYNNLTNNRSKYTENGAYYLTGKNDYRLYRCTVSKEFYEAVHENDHYKIPISQCSEISARL